MGLLLCHFFFQKSHCMIIQEGELGCRYIQHFTSSLVVMSHKKHACSVFALHAYGYAALVRVAPRP